MNRLYKTGLCSSIMALSSWSTASHAQSDAPDQSGGIQDIVVTAQKRDESLQKVPISINAFTSETLEASGIRSAMDLSQATPGMNTTQSGGLVQPFLRGIGNPVITAGNESSVAMYVDGVYFSRLPFAFFEFADIERVEVLKGPQGTLFGRNASGGLIHLISRDPGQDLTMKMSVEYANYNTVTASAFVGGALSDKIRVSLSGYYRNQGDGWGKSVANGSDSFKKRTGGVRGKLIFEPDDATEIRVAGDYIWSKGDLGATVTPLPGTTAGAPSPFPPIAYGAFPGGSAYNTWNNTSMTRDDKGGGVSLQAKRETGIGQLMSLTAYRKDLGYYQTDADNTPQTFSIAYGNYFSKQLSQEFQLTLPKSDVFDGIAGLYYLHSRAGYRPTASAGPGMPFGVTVYGEQTLDSYAAYGQGTLHVTPTTNITAGLRYTIDEVEGNGRTDIITAAGVTRGTPLNPKDTFRKLTYKFSVDQEIGSDTMVYASLSRGYKAGTYSTAPLAPVAAKPETLDAYEVGLKTTFLDHKVRLNASAFYYDLKDPQVQIIVTNNNIQSLAVLNAKSARIKGAELDLEIAPFKSLSLRANGSYTDAKYKSFDNAPLILPNPNPPYGGTPVRSVDAGGNRMLRTPKWTASVAGTYTADLGAVAIIFDANYSYNGGFFWDPANVFKQKAYSLLNAGIRLKPKDADISLRLWGRNLTKELYYTSISASGGPVGIGAIPGSPRTYGATLSAEF